MTPEQIDQMCIRRTGKARRTQAEKREANRLACRTYLATNRERNKQKSLEWFAANRDQALERMRARSLRNIEAELARFRIWKRANPEKIAMASTRRRAMQRAAFVEDVDRRVLLERFAGRCGWCSEPVDPAAFHVDHIVALVHGGEHSYANTQPVHPACNYEKRTVLKERAA